MKNSHYFVILALNLFVGLSPALAVKVYTSTPTIYESAAGNGLGFSYVGNVNGASGVYLGNYNGSYYVLTANHVGGGNFSLNSTNYSMVTNSYTQVTPGVDLGIFRIVGDSQLDALTKLVLGSSLFTSSSLNMIGYGGGTKRGGFNTPDSAQFITYDGYNEVVLITDYDMVEGQAQAIGGDSGGGVFYQNGSSLELAGLIVIAGTDNTSKEITGSVDVGYYRNQILARVPEASTVSFWIVISLFFIGYTWRYQKSRCR